MCVANTKINSVALQHLTSVLLSFARWRVAERHVIINTLEALSTTTTEVPAYQHHCPPWSFNIFDILFYTVLHKHNRQISGTLDLIEFCFSELLALKKMQLEVEHWKSSQIRGGEGNKGFIDTRNVFKANLTRSK